MLELYVPFEGYYESSFVSIIDDAIDNCFRDESGEVFTPWMVVSIPYSELKQTINKDYIEYLYDEYGVNIQYVTMYSPKYYNYETDTLLCNITKFEVERMFNEVDKDELKRIIKERHASCDGFISFYDNDIEKWPENVLEWDAVQLETLYIAFTGIYKHGVSAYDMYDGQTSHLEDIVYTSLSEKLKEFSGWLSENNGIEYEEYLDIEEIGI